MVITYKGLDNFLLQTPFALNPSPCTSGQLAKFPLTVIVLAHRHTRTLQHMKALIKHISLCRYMEFCHML